MTTPWLFWDVDTQFDFMDPEGALYVPEAETLVGTLARLTDLARNLQIPVVASADDHELSDAEIDPDAPDYESTFPPHCMRGTRGAERVEATRLDYSLVLGHEARPRDEIRRALAHPWPRVLLQKKELDVFGNPNTETVLELLDPARIVVYGVALDFCNRKVVEGLTRRGHRDLVVLADAAKPIDAERGEELLARWRADGLRVTTSEALAAELDRSARHATG